MKAIRRTAYLALVATAWVAASNAWGQIVINEIVEDEQDFESTDVGDNREFIELYNAGGSSVDISGWTLNYWMLTGGAGGTSGTYFATFDAIPAATSLAAGDYYVVGASTVPNVDLPLGSNVDLFPNSTTAAGGTVFELWNGDRTAGGTAIVDAVALDTFRNTELANANQAQLDQIAAGQTVGPAARGGWWGQVESNDINPADTSPTSPFPNLPMSIGRYRDGYDHNVNGRDFGMIPATPGTTNNLSQVSVHDVTNVDAITVGNPLTNDYYASFKLPRVINPAAVGPAIGANNLNPSVIPASPQGGRAIVAWDETGGGNAAYSDEYSNEFKIYAYIDPTNLANTSAAASTNSEATIYGIAGTTDLFFGTPNSADLLTGQPAGNVPSSANGSTGVGWLIQRRTSRDAGGVNSSAAVLQLIDFNDGGDGVIADNDWQIKHQIDLTGASAGWHVLGVKYDPTTGNVTATYDSVSIPSFTTTTDLVGNFYVGYRENLPGTGNTKARPPTYDLYVAPPGLLGDFNNDNKVDAADYVVWRKNETANNSLPNDNSLTNQAARFALWKANFGNPGSGGGLGAGAVPEPGSLLLVLTGLALVGAARRSRRAE